MSTVVPPEVYKTLKKVIKEDIKHFEITVHDSNKKGDGFLGDMVYVTLENKKSNEVLHLIVKQAFVNQAVRDSNPIHEVYMNEIYFYTKVWKRLNKFQQKIPRQHQFQKLPKYFTSVSKDCSEKLVLENLKFQNFEVYNKKIPLDKQHFELIFRDYGKFHALSFAYKSLYPKEYAKLTKKLIDLYMDYTHRDGFTKAIKITNDIVMEALQSGTDAVVIEKFRPYVENYVELFKDSIDSNIKYSVITHGDCWSNMMFKYSEDRKLMDVRFFDFQLVRKGSPCCDLSYCFYSGASKEELKDLDHFLQIYHSSLSETITSFGCDPQQLYPFHELKDDWKRFCKMGVMMSLMIWKNKCTSEESIVEINDERTEEEKEKVYSTDYDKDTFEDISRNLILHLHENDFL